MNNNKEIAIIGGGASGLFCAILLQEKIKQKIRQEKIRQEKIKQDKISNINITIYEGQNKIGKKILQTGNGKCNLCNMNITANDYNTNEINNLINEFKPTDLIDIFNNWGLMTRVDEEGRVYPYSEKATTVLDVLLNKISELNIKVNTNCYISKINKQDDEFELYTNDNKKYLSDYLVVSTGGSSSITYNSNGYSLLKNFGHSYTSIQPSLCALKTKENTKHLSGIRVKCKASMIVDGEVKKQTQGEVLFKDDGLSGIAIFILSQFYQKNKRCVVSLDLYQDKTIEELNNKLGKNKLESKLLGYFPKMVNVDLVNRYNNIQNNNINNNIDTTIGYLIKNYTFEIKDTYGFSNSQVTKGGIRLGEIDLNTFRSLKQNNLYISGEVLDIDGTCGGYNLYFAFASAYKIVLDILNTVKL